LDGDKKEKKESNNNNNNNYNEEKKINNNNNNNNYNDEKRRPPPKPITYTTYKIDDSGFNQDYKSYNPESETKVNKNDEDDFDKLLSKFE
jgi:hypothetical protein